ncbi:MAG TPA: SRPBCC family protein [Ohtaekwangia sp.]
METTQQIEINWPLKALFNYVSDVDNHGTWRQRVVNAAWLDKTRNHSGARVVETRKLMGQEIPTILEVTEFQPYRKRSVRLMKGTFRPSWTLEFEPNGESTLMTLTVTCPSSGREHESVIMKRMTEASFRELLKLKEILESEN